MNARASPDLSLLLPEPTPGEIIEARQRAGHTQAQAAQVVGLGSNMRWSEYERGARVPDTARWALYLLTTGQHPLAGVTPARVEKRRYAPSVEKPCP